MPRLRRVVGWRGASLPAGVQWERQLAADLTSAIVICRAVVPTVPGLSPAGVRTLHGHLYVTMAAVARRLVVRDTSTGLYHRARTVDSVPIYFTDIECDVKQYNLREAKVPLDASKRLLHACLFWPEAAA